MLAVAAVLAVVALNVGRQAFVGWSTDQQAAGLEAQVAAAEAENAALQRQLEYLQSDAYVSAEARRLQNVGYPGEQLLIIPPTTTEQAPGGLPAAAAADRPVLERWIELFFGSATP